MFRFTQSLFLSLVLCLVSSSAFAQPMFRLYNNSIKDHLISTDAYEATAIQAGYTPEGYAFNTLRYGDVPLYRCFTGSGHFVSTSPGCEGYSSEGFLGFAKTTPSGYADRMLYRCFNGGNDHLITINPQECYNNGFRIEIEFGYVSQ